MEALLELPTFLIRPCSCVFDSDLTGKNAQKKKMLLQKRDRGTFLHRQNASLPIKRLKKYKSMAGHFVESVGSSGLHTNSYSRAASLHELYLV